jgi:hypothetical protein
MGGRARVLAALDALAAEIAALKVDVAEASESRHDMQNACNAVGWMMLEAPDDQREMMMLLVSTQATMCAEVALAAAAAESGDLDL